MLYWMPLCRFARFRAGVDRSVAEDVTSQAFEILLTKRLLAKWMTHRSTKLRSLLCAVVRNVLSNRVRVQQRRKQIIKERGPELVDRADLSSIVSQDASTEDIDALYASWADQLLATTVEGLLRQLHLAGKGDVFRVLYGRVCEQKTSAEVARTINIPNTTAEYYYKEARKQLSDLLESQLREHVARYSPAADQDQEYAAEWARLGEHLKEHGGLEESIYIAHKVYVEEEPTKAIQPVMKRLAALIAGADETS